jgi:predicted TIM-barrel fold metal-dependent hydrolase
MPDKPDKMLTLDCQVHAYERDHPARPWIGTLQGPPQVTGDDMVVAMSSVGVDGAILVSPWSMYRFDASYALEVHARHPGRFGLVKPFDPEAPDVADQIARWAATEGVVGARIMLDRSEENRAGLDAILGACARHDLPVNILAWGKVPLLAELVRAHPDTRFVMDHMAIRQPFEPPPPSDPFNDIEAVLAMAAFDNVTIKISGACTLSREPFPFPDIWPPVLRILEAFGLERCMWGTDWTRAVELITYQEAVDAFRVTDALSDSDRATLMGGSLMKIYNWSPAAANREQEPEKE